MKKFLALALALLVSFNSTAHVVYGVNAHHTHDSGLAASIKGMNEGLDGMKKSLNASAERQRQAEAAEKQRQHEIRLKQMELDAANARSNTGANSGSYQPVNKQQMGWMKAIHIGQRSFTNYKCRDAGHFSPEFFKQYDQAIGYENTFYSRDNINATELANTLNYFMGNYVWNAEYCESQKPNALQYIDQANNYKADNAY